MKRMWVDGSMVDPNTGLAPITAQAETYEAAGEVRVRAWIADEGGVLSKEPTEYRVADPVEKRLHTRDIEHAAIIEAKKVQAAEVAELLVADPDEVTRRVARKEVTAERARELGWKPDDPRRIP